MKFQLKQNLFWFFGGAVVSVTALSLSYGAPTPAGIPGPGQVTDDTALYQHLSELQIKRELNPNFDQDLDHLSKLEGHYRERLPSLGARVRGPMDRISRTHYRYRGAPTPSAVSAAGTRKTSFVSQAPLHASPTDKAPTMKQPTSPPTAPIVR